MKKKKNTAKNIVGIIILILLILALSSVLVRCNTSSFSVQINNDVIKSDTTGYKMPSTAEIKINSPNSDALIFVYAKNADEDFAFTVDGESYSWSEVVENQTDFSTAFNVTKTEYGFTLKAEPIKELLSVVYGTKNVTVSNVPTGDIFELYVLSGDDTLKISFHLLPANGLTINPNDILI